MFKSFVILVSGFILFNGAASSSFTPMVGGAYNFSEDILNSLYLGARVGENFYTSTKSHNYVSPEFLVEISKRFQIFSQVAWAPRFYVKSRSQATASDNANWQRGSYLEYAFVPIQLSVLF